MNHLPRNHILPGRIYILILKWNNLHSFNHHKGSILNLSKLFYFDRKYIDKKDWNILGMQTQNKGHILLNHWAHIQLHTKYKQYNYNHTEYINDLCRENNFCFNLLQMKYYILCIINSSISIPSIHLSNEDKLGHHYHIHHCIEHRQKHFLHTYYNLDLSIVHIHFQPNQNSHNRFNNHYNSKDKANSQEQSIVCIH